MSSLNAPIFVCHPLPHLCLSLLKLHPCITYIALPMQGKGMFLYSAVSSPLDRSKRFTLFLPWQTSSFRHQLGFSWKHSRISSSNYAQWLFTQMSTTIYSQVLIYSAEWTGASRRERKCPNFETVPKGIRTRAPLIASPAFYRWATALLSLSPFTIPVHIITPYHSSLCSQLLCTCPSPVPCILAYPQVSPFAFPVCHPLPRYPTYISWIVICVYYISHYFCVTPCPFSWTQTHIFRG